MPGFAKMEHDDHVLHKFFNDCRGEVYPGGISIAPEISSREKNTSGSGWESNPPGVFSDATLGLKPRAVTRAAYAPEGFRGYYLARQIASKRNLFSLNLPDLSPGLRNGALISHGSGEDTNAHRS